MAAISKFRHAVWIALIVVLSVGPAAAEACQDQIAQFEARIAQFPGGFAAGATLPESVGAKLGHQPTPDSVRRAEAGAQSRLAEILARAKAFDARGDHAGCFRALAEAEASFDP